MISRADCPENRGLAQISKELLDLLARFCHCQRGAAIS
jgi:hypothetical protein